MMQSWLLLFALFAQDPSEDPPPKPPAKPPETPEDASTAKAPKGSTMERLYKLVAKHEKGETYLSGDARITKLQKYGSGQVEGQARILYRSEKSEEAERAVLWDEIERPVEGRPVSIKTLVKEKEATILYPEDKTAFVYDLSKDGNLPWTWIFYRGIHAELEADYKITVIRDPEEKAVVEKPKDGPKGEAGGSGTGLLPGTRSKTVSAVDIRSLNMYILDLEPRAPKQKKQTSLFTIFIDPDTFRIVRVQYEDNAERVDVTLSNWKVCSPIPKDTFELDLSHVKVRNR